jgi:hypothetical protein
MAGRSGTNAVGVVTAGALTAEVVTLVPMVVITATAVCQRKPSGGTQSGLAVGSWVGAAMTGVRRGGRSCAVDSCTEYKVTRRSSRPAARCSLC